MRKLIRLAMTQAILAAGLAGFGTLALFVTPSSAAKTPSCSTISGATVKAALGGSVQSLPGQSTSSNSFYGYKQTTLSCTYSASINISLSTPASVADFNLALKTLKNVAGAKTLSGIGNDAFYGTGSNSSSSGTVVTDNLWVLVTGKSFFEISASKVTFAKEEALAKKIVPLV